MRKRSCSVKSKSTRRRFSQKGSLESQSGKMSTPWTDECSARKALRSISSQQDSHAQHSHTLESEKESTINAESCSGKSPESLGRLMKDRDIFPRYSLRTSMAFFPQMEEELLLTSSVNFPRWGIMRDGELLELATPVRLTEGNGCLSWPTPTSTERSGTNPKTGKGEGLSKTVKQWPTRTKQDGENDGGPSQFDRNSLPLNAYVKLPEGHMMHGDARLVESLVFGSLNPDWVEWLQGLFIGWTDIDCDEPQEHPGWDEDPAERLWMTPKAKDGEFALPRTSGRPKEMSTHLGTQVDCCPGSDHNIPRLTTVKKNRVNRLKACGNGVVPQQATLALKLLLGRDS